MKLKFPSWGTTATGTAIGFAVGGPIGAPIGAAVGGVVDLLRRRRKKVIPAVALAILQRAAPGVPAAALSAAASVANATPPKEATALHDYMRKHMKIVWTGDPTAMLLIVNFQRAFMADPNAAAIRTKLKVAPTGFFDFPTSAALTFYTHDPVAPDPTTFLPKGGGGGAAGGIAASLGTGVVSSVTGSGGITGGGGTGGGGVSMSF